MTLLPTQVSPKQINDCWNRIGVVGDQSCEKLRQHVHCRNCEVYADAAQRILQRTVSAEYKADWARHFCQIDNVSEKSDTSILVFRVFREWLALPTRIFLGVAPHASAHKLPHRSGHGLSGIVNVGGKLYPCMSLATLLGIDEQDVPQRSGHRALARLLVIQWEKQAFALPVTDLHGVVRYAASTMQAPAATINKGLSRFLSGVITHADMHIGCLDADLIGTHLRRLLR